MARTRIMTRAERDALRDMLRGGIRPNELRPLGRGMRTMSRLARGDSAFLPYREGSK